MLQFLRSHAERESQLLRDPGLRRRFTAEADWGRDLAGWIVGEASGEMQVSHSHTDGMSWLLAEPVNLLGQRRSVRDLTGEGVSLEMIDAVARHARSGCAALGVASTVYALVARADAPAGGYVLDEDGLRLLCGLAESQLQSAVDGMPVLLLVYVDLADEVRRGGVGAYLRSLVAVGFGLHEAWLGAIDLGLAGYPQGQISPHPRLGPLASGPRARLLGSLFVGRAA